MKPDDIYPIPSVEQRAQKEALQLTEAMCADIVRAGREVSGQPQNIIMIHRIRRLRELISCGLSEAKWIVDHDPRLLDQDAVAQHDTVQDEIEAAIADLLTAYPDGAWRRSYMGDDVLIGLLDGYPVCVWNPGSSWVAKRHFQSGPPVLGSSPSDAISRWRLMQNTMNAIARSGS